MSTQNGEYGPACLPGGRRDPPTDPVQLEAAVPEGGAGGKDEAKGYEKRIADPERMPGESLPYGCRRIGAVLREGTGERMNHKRLRRLLAAREKTAFGSQPDTALWLPRPLRPRRASRPSSHPWARRCTGSSGPESVTGCSTDSGCDGNAIGQARLSDARNKT